MCYTYSVTIQNNKLTKIRKYSSNNRNLQYMRKKRVSVLKIKMQKTSTNYGGRILKN